MKIGSSQMLLLPTGNRRPFCCRGGGTSREYLTPDYPAVVDFEIVKNRGANYD
jgi:hypothetical protein